MRNTIKIICVIIGAVIGAGFASGKEIYLFFNCYGVKGILGIILASILTGIIIYKVLKQISSEKVINYEEYIKCLGINKTIGKIMLIIINIFLLISFYIMIAGCCAFFKQEYGVSELITGVIVAFLCYIVLIGNINGVTKINLILIPFLIGMIFLIGIKNNLFNLQQIYQTSEQIKDQIIVKNSWLISSIEYASYNSILLIPMLIGMKQYIQKNEKTVGIVVAFTFGILAIILFTVLLTGGIQINNIELPLVYIVNQFGRSYHVIYGIVIIAAIFTTAVATGYSFLENTSRTEKSYKKIAAMLCISSILVAKIGFSYLVNLLYPIFGILGCFQIFYILKKK